MNLEQRLSDDLHGLPPELMPPPGLADTVLRDLRRQRRNRVLTAAVAVAILVVGIPVTVSQLRGGEDPQILAEDPTPPRFPTPGGGPQAIYLYTTDFPSSQAFLLDPDTGNYRPFPFTDAALSPDLRTLALVDERGAGVVDREALLRDGTSAIRWFDLDGGSQPLWAPDGTAVLFTTVDKTDGIGFTAHRYDLATGTITRTTPINVDIIGSTVGWAPDSTRYLALLRGEQTADTVQPGPLQYIEPDGTPGERVEIEGGMVGGAESYSGDRVLLDSSSVMSAERVPSRVFDLGTGDVVSTLLGRPIGWYDDDTVVQLRGTFLEALNITTGTLVRRISLADLPQARWVQIGSSAGVPEEYGF